MDINKILLSIAKDVAYVQHNSDVLSQWPISSVEAMYYSGPFLMPQVGKNFHSWENNPNELFNHNLMPGKLAGLIFYFLNPKATEMMGAENHRNLLLGIISKIMFYKDKNFFEDYKSVGWIPNWNFCKADNQNAQELVFLLDNLTEMVNPIFRSFGVQLFFDKVNVYRYYYRTNLDYNLIIASPKKDMKIDFFEHIIKSENLDKSKVYVEKDGILSVVDMVSLKQDIKEKINEIKKSEKFDKEYVIKQIFSAFEYEISEQQKGFLNSPFPKEIKEFYIQTCKLPVEKLEKGISKVLGVDEK